MRTRSGNPPAPLMISTGTSLKENVWLVPSYQPLIWQPMSAMWFMP